MAQILFKHDTPTLAFNRGLSERAWRTPLPEGLSSYVLFIIRSCPVYRSTSVRS